MIRTSRAFLFAAFVLSFASASFAESPELPLWLLHTKFSGDFRYRHEMTSQEERVDTTVTSYDRLRHRIRFRVGMVTSPNDYVSVGFRLVSGGDNPRSTNQDLSASFSTKDFRLDRAYLDYHPNPNWTLLAGKTALPFMTTSQLIWDSDVSPEGITLSHACKFLTFGTKLTASGLWTQEYRTEDDQGLLAIQGIFGHKSDDLDWEAAIAYYDFQNAQSHALFREAAGNTQQVRGSQSVPYYEHDYDLLSVSGKVSIPVTPKASFRVFFDVVENTAIPYDRHGAIGGLGVSGKGGVLPYSLEYSYRDVEADATIGAFTESDFAEGFTDVSGHGVKLSVNPLKELQLALTGFLGVTEKSTNELDYKSLLLDAVVKF